MNVKLKMKRNNEIFEMKMQMNDKMKIKMMLHMTRMLSLNI